TLRWRLIGHSARRLRPRSRASRLCVLHVPRRPLPEAAAVHRGRFEQGEMAVHIIDPGRRDEHVERTRSFGIDTTWARATGQLDLRGSTNAHLRVDTSIEPGCSTCSRTFESAADGRATRAFAS